MRRYVVKHQSETGFTLLEVLVVVILIGVLASIAAPGWLAFMNRRRLNAANDQVLQAIRQAQIEAKRTRSNREVRFDVNSSPPRVAVLPFPDAGRIPDPQVTNWQALGQGEIRPGLLSLRDNNPNGDFIVFDGRGMVAPVFRVPTNPDISETQPYTVTVGLNNGNQNFAVVRCNRIRTLLGAVTQGSTPAECPP